MDINSREVSIDNVQDTIEQCKTGITWVKNSSTT